MDVLETSVRILSAATNGASHMSVMALHRHLRLDQIRWLLEFVIDKNLLELDSSETYWTTVNGVKFLEIRFRMEQMLQAQKSLV